jgi:hypothetical protein
MLRTGQPLTLDQIRGVAPAVFAEQPHSSRGPRYAYVPTITPLQTLLDNSWGVFEAAQQRSRDADRDPYTKHMLRIRKLDSFKKAGTLRTVGELVPEVILINGHDGTAAYHLRAGLFRFVCSNGMMVGQHMAGFRVQHTIGKATSQEVLEAGERTVTEKFPLMLEYVDQFKAYVLPEEKQMHLARTAMKLRYADTVPPFEAHELLRVQRDEDRDPTLWNMLNRIQENIMNGGWETRSAMFGRRSMVRPVERVSAVAKINGGLWDEATAMLEAA